MRKITIMQTFDVKLIYLIFSHLYFLFDLQVEVTFVDLQSSSYVKSKKPCEFWLRGNGHGVLENPKHSLAPNTTCLYHLQVCKKRLQKKNVDL